MPLACHPDVTNAASYGHIDMLEWLLKMLGDARLFHNVLDTAVESGHLPMCQWILQQHGEQTWLLPGGIRRPYSIWCGYHLGIAAREGHQHLLDWLLQLHRNDPERYPLLHKPRRTRARLGLSSRQHNAQVLLKGAATGCSLATMQSLCDEYIPHILFVPGDQGAEGGSSCPLLLQLSEQRELVGGLIQAAAASPTPDWQDKVDWLLLAHWPGGGTAVACGGGSGGGGGARLLLPQEACTAAAGLPSPGALPRLLWLQGRGFPPRPLDVLLQVLCVTGDGAVLQHLVDRHGLGRLLEQQQQQQEEGEELMADGDGAASSGKGGRDCAGAGVHLTAARLLAALCKRGQPEEGRSLSSSSAGWRNRALAAAVPVAARRGQLEVLEALSRVEPEADADVWLREWEYCGRGRQGRCVPCGRMLIEHVVEVIQDKEELIRVLHWLQDNGRWWPLDVHGEPYERGSSVVQGWLPSAAAVNWWLRDQGFEVLDEHRNIDDWRDVWGYWEELRDYWFDQDKTVHMEEDYFYYGGPGTEQLHSVRQQQRRQRGQRAIQGKCRGHQQDGQRRELQQGAAAAGRGRGALGYCGVWAGGKGAKTAGLERVRCRGRRRWERRGWESA